MAVNHLAVEERAHPATASPSRRATAARYAVDRYLLFLR